MKCFSVNIEKTDKISTSLVTEEGISSETEKLSFIQTLTEKIGSATFFLLRREYNTEYSISREGGISCELVYTDEPNIPKPYLEIEPTYLWVYPDFETMNDVYSNVTWKID